jgi:hypothetical protein
VRYEVPTPLCNKYNIYSECAGLRGWTEAMRTSENATSTALVTKDKKEGPTKRIPRVLPSPSEVGALRPQPDDSPLLGLLG